MIRPLRWLALGGAALLLLAPGARAATQAEAAAALQTAEQQEAEAGRLRNQWIPTEAALKEAQQAMQAGDYGKALDLARRAEALARRSVEQAREQEKLWTQAVIR